MRQVRYGKHVREALRDHRPVVALESTIISHGLPRPRNLEVAREIEETVRAGGAVPATIGMVGGELVVGLDDDELSLLATADEWPSCRSATSPSPPRPAARGHHGGQTAALAAHAGIAVFATGGLGGVHREATRDASTSRPTWPRWPDADRGGLRGRQVHPRRGGDAGAAGDARGHGRRVRIRRFPGFYLGDSGFDLDWRVDTPEAGPAIMRARQAQGVHARRDRGGQPAAGREQLDPDLHDRVLAEGLAGPTATGHRQGRHAVPARPLPRGDRRGEPRGERPDHPAQRRRWPPGSRPPTPATAS